MYLILPNCAFIYDNSLTVQTSNYLFKPEKNLIFVKIIIAQTTILNRAIKDSCVSCVANSIIGRRLWWVFIWRQGRMLLYGKKFFGKVHQHGRQLLCGFNLQGLSLKFKSAVTYSTIRHLSTSNRGVSKIKSKHYIQILLLKSFLGRLNVANGHWVIGPASVTGICLSTAR